MRWCRQNHHFVVATLLLAASAAAINFLEWGKRLPVPWPEGVAVTDDFRMISLPKRAGTFVAVSKDRYGRKFDGGMDVILSDHVLKALAIGTSKDETRLKDRESNWYVSREYRDTSIKDVNSPFGRWNLQVCYYTGIRDKVPHVPERCMAASGFKVQGVHSDRFQVFSARSPWDEKLKFNRVVAQKFNQRKDAPDNHVVFYLFSLNGEPETSWETIRIHLSLSLKSHSYFAKIQFSPMGDMTGYKSEEIHKHAVRFLDAILPGIIERLPRAEDVEKLREAYEED